MFTKETPITAGEITMEVSAVTMAPRAGWEKDPANPSVVYRITGRAHLMDPETEEPTIVQLSYYRNAEKNDEGLPIAMGFETAPPSPTYDQYAAPLQSETLTLPSGGTDTRVKLDKNGLPVFADNAPAGCSPLCAKWMVKHPRMKVSVFGERLSVDPTIITSGADKDDFAMSKDGKQCLAINGVEEWDWAPILAACRSGVCTEAQKIGAGEHVVGSRKPVWRTKQEERATA